MASGKTPGHGLSNGIPIFLDQIIETLTIEQSSDLARSELQVSGLPGGGSISEVGDSAAQHARYVLAQQGFGALSKWCVTTAMSAKRSRISP